ncbi:MAG: class I SAM-dependent methyltransferase [Acidobacteriota bacterium]|nr:class I SAM-dependent methyltransferase [Acidobacteriota bacterium]
MPAWNDAGVSSGLNRKRPHLRGLFDRMAGRYDRFNSFSSLGMDRWWRYRAVKGVAVRGKILDLGSGGGQMAQCLKTAQAFCVGVDPAYAMLAEGRRRGRCFTPVQARGEFLPFRDNTWDGVISGFVMRNLDDIRRTITECFRTLRPGGTLVVLEFFPPRSRLLRAFFRVYLGRIVPRVFAGDLGQRRDIEWLSRSIGGFMSPGEFAKLVRECGFSRVEMRPLIFRIAWRLVAVKQTFTDSCRQK